jgi:hypothetical protein
MWSRFAWGVLGALAPEIVRLYRARLRAFTPPRSYWPISVAFALLGGGLAVLFAGSSPASGFYVGLASPFLVAGMVRSAKRSSVPKPAAPGPQAAPDQAQLDVDLIGSMGVAPTAGQRLAMFICLL